MENNAAGGGLTRESRAVPRGRRIPRLGWLIASVLGILALVVVGCCTLPGVAADLVPPFAAGGTPEATATASQTFAVGMRPTLIIRDTAGNVTFAPGKDGQVVVTATTRVRDRSATDARRILGAVSVQMAQDGNTIGVATHFPSDIGPGDSPTVDLALAVPVATQINAEVTTGDVMIRQIAGQMNVTTTTGDITGQDAIIAGGSHFTTTTGNITLDGQMNSASLLQVKVGTGNIVLRMPPGIPGHLDALTDAGSITVKGWPITVEHEGAGARAVGDLHPGPVDVIILRAGSGNITFESR